MRDCKVMGTFKGLACDMCEWCTATNDNADWNTPNAKDVCCLAAHVAALAREMYEAQDEPKKNTYSDVLFYTMYSVRQQLRYSAEMSVKWQEAERDRAAFEIARRAITKTIAEDNTMFLLETAQLLDREAQRVDKCREYAAKM